MRAPRATGPGPNEPSYAGPVFSDPTNGHALRRSTAWGAVFAGAVAAVVVQFVLTVLGIAIGISVAPEAGESAAAGGATAGAVAEAAQDIGIGAGVWWLISGTLSLLIGGMVLGRLWMHEDTVVGGPAAPATDRQPSGRPATA